MATHHKTHKETESRKQNCNISLFQFIFLLCHAHHKTQKEIETHVLKIPSHANNTIIVQTQRAIHQRQVRKLFVKQTQPIQRNKKPVLSHGCGFMLVALIGEHGRVGLKKKERKKKKKKKKEEKRKKEKTSKKKRKNK